ncbi:MAG: DUF4910 domain-containing protein [Hyphomicrobiaceae bacterium]
MFYRPRREVASTGARLGGAPEWNIREAHITDPSGRRVVDFANHNLHVVSYSVPVRRRMTLGELRPYLHSLPEQPDLIPYRTAYYTPAWGFCLPHSQLEAMADDTYDVVIDATLEPGSLTYGEVVIPGESDEEVLLSAHVCHPSLANDNCSGLATLAWLGRLIGQYRRRYTYRLLFAPGTIGAIAWLAANRERTARVRHGLILSNLGDGAPPLYSAAGAVMPTSTGLPTGSRPERTCRPGRRLLPYGYDERQYCSPGFDLPVGAFQRSRWGEFAAYHTSADNMSLIAPAHLAHSASLVAKILDVLEANCRPLNTLPYGEPQLGRRGVYDDAGGRPLPQDVRLALLWVLNLADGRHSLIDIAERSGIAFPALRDASKRLYAAGLLVDAPSGLQ